MAIPVECWNLILPVSVIEKKYPGGWVQCREDFGCDEPGSGCWTDGELFRLGAMNPIELALLESDFKHHGFKSSCTRGKKKWTEDMCSFNSTHGPDSCDWLSFDELSSSVSWVSPALSLFPVPTQTDQDHFLRRLYFGGADKGSDLKKCIAKAYRDVCRTIRGIATHPFAAEIRCSAENTLFDAIEALARNDVEIRDQLTFDTWHKDLCDQLKESYSSGGFAKDDEGMFTYGHAQKWINMTLKYVFVYGEAHLPGYNSLYAFCHVPIDTIIVKQLKRYGSDFPELTTAWSQITDYSAYSAFQKWIRETFVGSVPLAVEFALWQKDDSITTLQ